MTGGKKPVDWGAREGADVDAASAPAAAAEVSGRDGGVASQRQRGDAGGRLLSQLDRARFDALFHSLTGNPRFPWQCSLYERVVEGNFPERCDIPTGLGKTSIIAIWLLALAHRARNGVASGFPRRLVYVVNRRTVIDQATREAELLRDPQKLKDAQLQDLWRDLRSLGIQDVRGLRHLETPFAISTLRGQFADNAEWRTDPARPAIIVGTVDMIGSRLLFSGYGRGFKARPLHAGFLAQDTLLVHDEAHLEPAFQELVTAIESEQRKGGGMSRDGFGRLRVIALTATSRGAEERPENTTLRITDADRQNRVVVERISAKKGIAFHPLQDKKSAAEQIANLALGHKDSGQAILVFVRKVEDVTTVTKMLPAGSYATLTGTMRGRERDQLKKTNLIFARFDPKSEVPETDVRKGTVYLVCTSAGEVGVDMSADHLVCDLTPFDSMAQRFGRVNRFGGRVDGVPRVARIDIVHVPEDSPPKGDSKKKNNAKDAFDVACERTHAVLLKLPKEDARHDASPAALSELPAAERRDAFTPSPVILPLTDILFDAWALTSIREKLPGRPPVADWLHGVPQEWDPPETYVAWRDEVELLSHQLLEKYKPQDLLEDYPLKPHELLRDRTDRVFKQIAAIAERCEDQLAWLIDSEGRVRCLPLSDLVANGQNKPHNNLADCTVLLPPRVGGLEPSGLLRGEVGFEEGLRYDVADEWLDERDRRRRYRLDGEAAHDDEEELARRKGMRLVCTIHLRENAESEDDETDDDSDANARRVWRWYVRPQFADDDGSRTATKPQTLPFHLESAEHFAREIVTRLGLKEPEASAVVWAARFHDLGKNRVLWQHSIGNRDPDRVLAKPGGKASHQATGYRHEFGSLFDVEREPAFSMLPDEAQELARHIIAVHHGRGRPHFSADESFDPNNPDKASAAISREVPRRFARLQRKYGRWGLAYLESLVRAADALASQVLETDAHDTPLGQAAAE